MPTWVKAKQDYISDGFKWLEEGKSYLAIDGMQIGKHKLLVIRFDRDHELPFLEKFFEHGARPEVKRRRRQPYDDIPQYGMF